MPDKNYARKYCDELSTVQSDITLLTFHHNKHNYNVSNIDENNVVAFTHLIEINVFM